MNTVLQIMFNSTPSVLLVGNRCMEIGDTFIWPYGQNPFFIRPDRMLMHLVVENYIPYLAPGSEYCKPRKPAGSMSLLLCFPDHVID